MVAKKRSTAGSKPSKKPVSGTSTPTGGPGSKRKTSGGQPLVLSAKTTDIISVLENTKLTGGIAVGHLVEAMPTTLGPDVKEYFMGEVVAIKQVGTEPFFYIHFLGEDAKLDDWVPRGHVRSVSAFDIEARLSVRGLNTPFFTLSSFSTTASAVHPRSHVKSIRGVQLGNSVVLKAWYPSPYPEMMSCVNAYIKLCDTCLSYFRTADELSRHWLYCTFAHPPGIEVYRDAAHQVSIFEIDGEAYNGYCERLLLLAKLFLGEKRACSQDASQYAQVRTFHFYVVCRWNEGGRAEIVGYFSKLKNPARESHILSCILVLPHEQRKGFGKFLIDLSYELAKIEGRFGSAERPLSDLGQLSFYPYWMRRLLPHLDALVGEDQETTVVLNDLASKAGIVPDDVVEVLKHYGMLKEWGTTGVVLVCNPEAISRFQSSKSTSFGFNPQLLHWTPSYSLT